MEQGEGFSPLTDFGLGTVYDECMKPEGADKYECCRKNGFVKFNPVVLENKFAWVYGDSVDAIKKGLSESPVPIAMVIPDC